MLVPRFDLRPEVPDQPRRPPVTHISANGAHPQRTPLPWVFGEWWGGFGTVGFFGLTGLVFVGGFWGVYESEVGLRTLGVY